MTINEASQKAPATSESKQISTGFEHYLTSVLHAHRHHSKEILQSYADARCSQVQDRQNDDVESNSGALCGSTSARGCDSISLVPYVPGPILATICRSESQLTRVSSSTC